ncbi:MAG: hypothetical protein O2923_11885 [Verrucomicrobia bacterium]|nr:hypothetical protein [Verrucomicrobiota bacterium]MDA1087234.1 hypothetical protein [Verrucomicrobiota bacterium]
MKTRRQREDTRFAGAPTGEDTPGLDRAARRAGTRKRLGCACVVVALIGHIHSQLDDLRGALAHARLMQLVKIIRAHDSSDAKASSAISHAYTELQPILTHLEYDAAAIADVAYYSLAWSADKRMDTLTRLRFTESAFKSSSLAVDQAPSDYVNWLWLSRSLSAFRIGDGASTSLKRAHELAPPGMLLPTR